MKKYCIDLEIAKELKINGFSQNTHYFWARYNKKVMRSEQWDLIDRPFSNEALQKPYYSAPTTDEILKELPNEINGYVLEIIRYEDGAIEADYTKYVQHYEDTEYLIQSKKLFYKLSNCVAELWIDLKKEGYIK